MPKAVRPIAAMVRLLRVCVCVIVLVQPPPPGAVEMASLRRAQVTQSLVYVRVC
jgi:hypothetical protein